MVGCGGRLQAVSIPRRYNSHMHAETFPIDLTKLEPLKPDPSAGALTDAQKPSLQRNIQLCRDAIVFFTALARAKGLSGATGAAHDTVPEESIIPGLIVQA